jgi:DNA-binding response OmpR family regulator
MPNQILVVDDDRALCATIETALQKAGLSVRVAHDGRQCLEAVAAERPDVIVLDVTMPVMNGFKALRELRRNPKTNLLPVVMLTGNPGEPGELAAWITEIDRYLAKPCDIARLVAAVKELLPEPAEV